MYNLSLEEISKTLAEDNKKKTPHVLWGEKVHEVLFFQGRKMDWLATQIGLNRSELSHVLRGDTRYKASNEVDSYLIDQIAKATGVPPSFFTGESQ